MPSFTADRVGSGAIRGFRWSAILVALILAGPAQAADPSEPSCRYPALRFSPDVPDSYEECTIAVVSPAASRDGRPLLCKNRDSGYVDNEAVYFSGGKYSFVSLVNAGDTQEAWIGVNSAGFAVLNALSYNIGDSLWGGITNGRLMKLALESCGTVDEFEALLRETAHGQGRENPANLGVIDAEGGAAIFEVGNRHHHRFDAGNPADAPDGFLVRANFSLAYDTTTSQTWRYRRARELMGKAARHGVERIHLFDMTRDLRSEYVDPYPLPCDCAPPGYPGAIGYVDTYETINRVSSVASGLIQGVQPGENPLLSTLFLALGAPAAAPFVPLWVAAASTPPQMNGDFTAPFCDLAKQYRTQLYDYPGNWRFLNSRKLVQPMATRPIGLVRLRTLERRAHARVDSLLVEWRAHGLDPLTIRNAENAIAAKIFFGYKEPGSALGGEPIVRVTPNPSHGEIVILSTASESMEVFDVSGRRIARLEGSPGGFRWDGRDETGRPAASGIYYCRPRSAGGPTVPITLLR